MTDDQLTGLRQYISCTVHESEARLAAALRADFGLLSEMRPLEAKLDEGFTSLLSRISALADRLERDRREPSMV